MVRKEGVPSCLRSESPRLSSENVELEGLWPQFPCSPISGAQSQAQVQLLLLGMCVPCRALAVVQYEKGCGWGLVMGSEVCF